MLKNPRRLAEETSHCWTSTCRTPLIQFFPLYVHTMPVLLYILTSSTPPIPINITGFSFQLHYLIQESGFDLTKLTSFKILTFYNYLFTFSLSNFFGYWSSTARCDLNKQLMARKVKTFELRKCDWVKFLTSFSRQDKVWQKQYINNNFLHFHTLMFQCWLFSLGAQRQAVSTALYDKTLYGE